MFILLLHQILDKLPTKFYCHYLPEHEKILRSWFNMTYLGLHQKMRLDKSLKINTVTDSNIINLTEQNLHELEELYRESYPENYFNARMLKTGYYYGIEDDNNKILSVVGIHTYSKEHNIAVLGNITTHPTYRGRGYATKLLQKLIIELSESVSNVSLNVKKDNTSAIKLYERLGFVHCIDYKEALFEK